MTRTLALLVLLSLAVASCSQGGVAPAPVNLVPPTETLSPSPTVAPSPTAPPATPTSLPAELLDLIKHVYITILMTQVDAQMVAEAANRSLSGELSGADRFATTIMIASLIQAVDESLSADQPPEALLGPWQDARSIHDQTKQLLSAWFNSEADAAATVSSMQPVLDEAESILTDLETILAEQYDFNPDELAAQRQETLQSIPDIFATPTPSG
jgi:hypothetical protein